MASFGLRASLVRVGVLGAFVAFGSGFGFEPSLKIGNPAPPIRYTHWIKGEPVRRFEHGRVYVIDFWATWCEPCKRSMPHLTELAKKYAGKAIFIGVNARQTERKTDGSLKTVQDFVKGNAANMGYRIAMDDPVKQTVFGDWMTASGNHGIPTAFVIDGSGKIAWIGHPMMGLDEAMAKVLGGSAKS